MNDFDFTFEKLNQFVEKILKNPHIDSNSLEFEADCHFVGEVRMKIQELVKTHSANHNHALQDYEELILHSPEYVDIVNKTRKSVITGLHTFTSNLDSKKPEFSSIDTSGATLDTFSLCSNSSLACLSNDELFSIHNDLDPHQPLQKRKNAVKRLISVSMADILAEEFWPITKIIVEAAALDKDIDIATFGLEIYANAFKVVPNYLVSDLYQGFLTVISKKTQCMAHLTEIDVNLPDYRLFAQYSMIIPNIWIRFTDRNFTDVVNSTLKLIFTFKDGIITPLHFISLVDPNSNWFKKWMLGHSGRKRILAAFQKGRYLQNLANWYREYLINRPKFVARSDKVIIGDLEYLKFLQISVILTKTIPFKSGRLCFPSFQQNDIAASIDNFLALMLDIIDSGIEMTSSHQSAKKYSGPAFITNLFIDLLTSNYNQKIVSFEKTFFKLILQFLDEYTTIQNSLKKVDQFLAITRILSAIASSKNGRKLIFSFENGKLLIQIAEYTSKSLKQKIKTEVIGNCIFLLRQFYRTCEGFNFLKRFKIDEALSFALEYSRNDESDFHTTLIDNLLNFASTPQGLLILEKSGNMNTCVSYMLKRYLKKLQVSQCEKFGYGAMVSKISTMKSGMAALYETGWIKLYLHDLWQLVRRDNEFSKMNLDYNNLDCIKQVQNALKIFTTYEGLSECLLLEKMDSKSSDEKLTLGNLISSFLKGEVDTCHPEEAKVLFFKVLLHIGQSLDCQILLNREFAVSRYLEIIHRDSFVSSSVNQFIIDESNLLLNRSIILFKTVGGPRERVLPPITHIELESIKDWIYEFDEIPKNININQVRSKRQHLTETSWQHFVECILNGKLDNSLDIFLKLYGTHKTPNSNSQKIILNDVDHLGIDIVRSYFVKLLPDYSPINVEEYFQRIEGFWRENWKYKGFDWFAATLFIMARGDHNLAFLVLSNLDQHQYLWRRSPKSSAIIQHWIEELLESKLPKIFSAFTLSGCTPSQLTERWLRECFWNVLDFDEICKYIYTVLLFGPQFQIYFCIAIITYVNVKLLAAARDKSFVSILHDSSLAKGFKLEDHVALINELHETYSANILADMT